MQSSFTFIDLFSGIGGFHQAMTNLGGRCVLASEIDEFAIETYKSNYGMDSGVNVNDLQEADIPDHDVLCAGFPCQPFSKAGAQAGFEDETKGTLFFQICRILKAKKPKFIVLENVRNLVSHDHGRTFQIIRDRLISLGYVITETPIIMSPHQLGVPQFRERVYILGIHKSAGVTSLDFSMPTQKYDFSDIFASGIIDTEAPNKYRISKYEEKVLTCWDEFYKGLCDQDKVIGFPVWMEEFKETYDYTGLPEWKQTFIRKNRELYARNKRFINRWLTKWNNLEGFTPTHRKFEWQAGRTIPSIWDGFIQLRPSGVRVKKPTFFPALVAMVQIPIIGKYRRRLTPREAARLQSFPDAFVPNPNDHQAYKQFGNAVNVNCVEYLTSQLLKLGGVSVGGRVTKDDKVVNR